LPNLDLVVAFFNTAIFFDNLGNRQVRGGLAIGRTVTFPEGDVLPPDEFLEFVGEAGFAYTRFTDK
jgi:hypothetical protein